ncbi:MAG: metallophosphoesterase [Acidobacteria bacterium]|nr:metallophosphoesterase [Acidobacteriota bacterium]
MRCRHTSHLLVLLVASIVAAGLAGAPATLPDQEGSLKFAVIGDSGTGGPAQYRVAKALADARRSFHYELVLMLGDNLYIGSDREDYRKAFEIPYKPMLDAGVRFYAALGNHDDPKERFYKGFNMNGERYYSFRPQPGVRIFALDSNAMDRAQLDWFEKALADSGSDWKICFFHHPLYSSAGRHGSDLALRAQVEPLLLKYGVDVVFAGHDHVYERIKPQKGIYYFVSGGAAKLRKGDIEASALTAKAFDTGNHFMLVELAGGVLSFEAISDTGAVVDSGSFTLR